MDGVAGLVVEVVDVGSRIRRIEFDVPQLAELGVPDVGDAAVGIYFPGTDTEGRNYTVRHHDLAQGRIVCDFVLHEHGLASDWVRQARVGEQVRLDHACSWYRPEPGARWQLLVADLAGLPALARILDELPPDTRATVVVEVVEPADLDYLPARPDVSTVVSTSSGNGLAPSRLAELVRAQRHPEGRGYCWFAGEASESRAVRKFLRAEHGWSSGQYDVVGYWRFDSESWDRRYEAVSTEVEAIYEQALADGMAEKLAAEAYDLALERLGL